MESRRGELPKVPLTAIDLFCGAGGFSLGLRDAGFELRGALDNDRKAFETYTHNFGGIGFHADAKQFDVSEFGPVRDLTVVVGGPPCQGFSIQRRGDRDDARNRLVQVFLDMALSLRPRFFVIENVLGLVSKHGKEFQEYVQREAASAGYHCHTAKLNAASYGVPQVRWRALIVGERLDDSKAYFKFPEPSHSESQFVTVRESIRDLPSPPLDGSPHDSFSNHFREARLSATNLARIRCIPEGGGREHLPTHLELPCHVSNRKHRHLDTYGRLAWDKPAVTITARFDSFTRGRFGHPNEDRTITLREGARLQSFPDSFKFFGNREEVARQIGNAVPPALAKAIGHSIADALKRRARREAAAELPEVQYSLL
jgi:DNA (cytosine-5)-methyltransferase 1